MIVKLGPVHIPRLYIYIYIYRERERERERELLVARKKNNNANFTINNLRELSSIEFVGSIY
jgi:hypothetical protein